MICALLLAAGLSSAATIETALNRMYNFDFRGADREMDTFIGEHPNDPVGLSFRAAAYLFRELDRLAILEAEFFASDKKILDKKKLTPDAQLKERFLAAIEVSRQKAQARLITEPNDKAALFALCLNAGLISDYTALIEKRQLGSLSYARESHAYALQLLKIDPDYADAYLTTGITEYLLGSVPFFVRWFLRFDDAQGSKTLAVDRLKLVVEKGKYLGPFAKILLVIVDLREKRPQSAELRLSELSREFPENQLFQRELQKLRPKIK